MSKGLRKLFFVLRKSKVFKNPNTVVNLYKSLVVLTLLFASTIWRPFLKVDLDKVERVQHLFLRNLAARVNFPLDISNHNYDLIMSRFGFFSCDELMKYYDLVFLFLKNVINSTNLLS